MLMEKILEELRAERDYQVGKWGTSVDDSENTPWMWAAYIGQYATRWMVGTFMPLKPDVTDQFRKCMVKVATLAIAAIESVDRQRQNSGGTFYEDAE
jgi:hypothetical protein